MKPILTFSISIILFSCGKFPKTPQQPLQGVEGFIQYKMNGSLVSMNNVNLSNGEGVIFEKELQGSQIPDTRYVLNSQKGINDFFKFTIVTDSLKAINYHYDSAGISTTTSFLLALAYNGRTHGIFFDGDYIDVNISSYISSYNYSRITGTFTAKLTPLSPVTSYDQRGTVLITEGVFNNVPVFY